MHLHAIITVQWTDTYRDHDLVRQTSHTITRNYVWQHKGEKDSEIYSKIWKAVLNEIEVDPDQAATVFYRCVPNMVAE